MITGRIDFRQPNSPPVGTNRRIACTLIALLSPLVLAPSLHAQENIARDAAGPPKRLSIAVLGLENQTGDPELAHCRYGAALLRNSFGQVKALRALSDNAVRYALRQVGLQPGDAIDPNHARAMGEHIEAQRVIWGRYSKKADLWQVRTRVMNVATGAISPEFSAAASNWYDIRDRLNAQILAELGITPSTDEKKKAAERRTRSAETLDWCFRVQLAQDEGKPITDLEMFSRKAIAADPNCAMAYGSLAAALATQGKFDPAEEAIEKALQLKPDFAQARATLGWMYLTREQYERAEAEFRRACQLDGNDVESLMWLAAACERNGRRDETLSLLERAVSLDRTDASVHAHLANAYAARKRQEDALRELEEARRYLPTGVSAGNALLMIGDTYRSLGRGPEAIESYERAIETVKGLGVNPNTLRYVEQRIQGVKSILAPMFIQASTPRRYTEEELDEMVRDKLIESERPLAAHPFLCTDAMKQWAQELTRGADTDLDKARALFAELSARPDTSGRAKSRMAKEVFDAWKNPEIRLVCMDKAVLFVALARAVDVNAFFVHVTKLPDGKVINHACAAVFLADRVLLVDPAQHWLGAPHQQYTILDDLKATAFLCFNNRDGDPAKLAAYRAGLKLWPDSLQARVFLAGALYSTGQESEARQLFAEIPPPQSQDWEAAIYWEVAAQSEAVEQHWERAKEHLLKSLSLCPGQSIVHYNLAKIYVLQHRLADARAEFRACLRYEPTRQMVGIAQAAIAQINEEIGSDAPPGGTVPEQKPQ
jgi:tetratricopeptide (TPR) repeat protein